MGLEEIPQIALHRPVVDRDLNVEGAKGRKMVLHQPLSVVDLRLTGILMGNRYMVIKRELQPPSHLQLS